jgi:hypothetical protein
LIVANKRYPLQRAKDVILKGELEFNGAYINLSCLTTLSTGSPQLDKLTFAACKLFQPVAALLTENPTNIRIDIAWWDTHDSRNRVIEGSKYKRVL